MTGLTALEGREDQARAALAAGRLAEAATLARALAEAAPERLSGWLYQALALILDGRAERVYRGLLPRRRALLACDDDVLFLKDVFLLLAGRKAHDAILAAAAQAPPAELSSVVPLYFAACVLLERREFEPGFALLGAVRTRCLANLPALPTTDGDGFMVLFRHALLVNDPGTIETPPYHAALAANRAKLGPLHWLPAGDAPADPRPVLAVSCDARYAERFLPRFLASVERLCSGRLVHLHLIDPDQEPPAPPPLAGNRLAVTWETSGELRCGAWYASARFVRMAALLERYRRPIMMFDADVALRHPVETIERAMDGADFGCFRMDRLDPGSVYQASLTVFRPTPAGLDLARLLGDLILSKMSIRRPLLWLIDQASLYSAITMMDGRLRVADFRTALGMEITDYLDWRAESEEKLRLLKLASEGTGDGAGKPWNTDKHGLETDEQGR